jgi:N-acetylmuramoyl-L-alanine amidase
MRKTIVVFVGVLSVLAVIAVLIAWPDLFGDDAPPSTAASATTVVTEPPATTSSSTTPTSTTTTSTTTTTLPPEPYEIPETPPPAPPAPAAELPVDWDGHGVVTIATGGADVVSAPGGDPFARIREGVVLAGRGLSTDGEWVRVFHMCDGVAWVAADEISAEPAAADAAVGDGFDFAEAVVIVDPGHGGPANIGATSGDVTEKSVNVEISARLRELLSAPRSIDWETGEILDGDDIPPAALVVVTRSGTGDAADYEAGLDFRAAVANSANAHALVSIHNNAGEEVELEQPGSDVFYQSQRPVIDESRRLAVLIVEEMRRGFSRFEASWVGAVQLGAKSRISPRDGVSQYYGVLKASAVPAVIAEGAYLSNPSEAALLRTPEFQHAYAAAVYRALVRFLTTDDPGSAPSHDPEVWEGFAGSGGARPVCELPTQP